MTEEKKVDATLPWGTKPIMKKLRWCLGELGYIRLFLSSQMTNSFDPVF